MHKRALVVGIDSYPTASDLGGCVTDATRVNALLERHHDGSANFNSRLLLGQLGEDPTITKGRLKSLIEELFASKADQALLYFSGHGFLDKTGGYLVTQDATAYDEGVAMRDVMTLAQNSPVTEVVIILDCCHAGAFGKTPGLSEELVSLREGISVLTASRAAQPAMEDNDGGVFSRLVCEALAGGAADVIGNVSAADLYAYADQALDAWSQRPMFMSHVSTLVPIRESKPTVPKEVLRKLPEYFPTKDHRYSLDPSFEPDDNVRPAEYAKNPAHEEIFAHLQKLRDGRLLVPVGADHMYYAAMNSQACELTELGKFYLDRAQKGLI